VAIRSFLLLDDVISAQRAHAASLAAVNADALASFCSCVSFDVIDQRRQRLMSLPPDTVMMQTLPISEFDLDCRGCGSDGASVTRQSHRLKPGRISASISSRAVFQPACSCRAGVTWRSISGLKLS